MAHELEFVPFPGLSSGHWQTIIGALPVIRRGPPSVTEWIPLPDGDELAVEVSTPAGWADGDKAILMSHGLAGSERSPYLVRLTRAFYHRGWRVYRLNLRGCGTGRGHARRTYHAGLSADLHEAVVSLHSRAPRSPLYVIGFSMTGNIVLKMAGEIGHGPSYGIAHIIAVCPAINLTEGARRIHQPENQFYERMFVRELIRALKERAVHFPDLPAPDLSPDLTLYEFDNLFTAPVWGFENADEYYRKASSKEWIPKIRLPCHILFARDDPMIDHKVLDNVNLPHNVHVWKASGGGHMGFLGSPVHGHSFRWMDDLLIRWCR